MARTKLEVPVQGMDCAECTMHVQHALAALPGVDNVHVLLSSEKAVLQIDPSQVDLPTIRKAVEGAGYTVPEPQNGEGSRAECQITRDVHPSNSRLFWHCLRSCTLRSDCGRVARFF